VLNIKIIEILQEPNDGLHRVNLALICPVAPPILHQQRHRPLHIHQVLQQQSSILVWRSNKQELVDEVVIFLPRRMQQITCLLEYFQSYLKTLIVLVCEEHDIGYAVDSFRVVFILS